MYSAFTPRLYLPRANEIDDNNRLAGPAFCIYPLFKPVYHFRVEREREKERRDARPSIGARHQMLQPACCNVNDRSASFYFYRYYRGGYATMEKSASHVGGISPAFARRKENRVNGLYESGESSSGSRGRDSHRRMDARQDGVRTKEEGREDPPR